MSLYEPIIQGILIPCHLLLTKTFKEPLVEVFDEEEHAEIDKLVIDEMKTKEDQPDKYTKI